MPKTVRLYRDGSLVREYHGCDCDTPKGIARLKKIRETFDKLKRHFPHSVWTLRVGDTKRYQITEINGTMAGRDGADTRVRLAGSFTPATYGARQTVAACAGQL